MPKILGTDLFSMSVPNRKSILLWHFFSFVWQCVVGESTRSFCIAETCGSKVTTENTYRSSLKILPRVWWTSPAPWSALMYSLVGGIWSDINEERTVSFRAVLLKVWRSRKASEGFGMETLRELQPCRWTLPTDVPEHRVPPKLVAETGRQSIYKTTGNCFKMFERLTSQDHDSLIK